jgi:hypothetical protein
MNQVGPYVVTALALISLCLVSRSANTQTGQIGGYLLTPRLTQTLQLRQRDTI